MFIISKKKPTRTRGRFKHSRNLSFAQNFVSEFPIKKDQVTETNDNYQEQWFTSRMKRKEEEKYEFIRKNNFKKDKKQIRNNYKNSDDSKDYNKRPEEESSGWDDSDGKWGKLPTNYDNQESFGVGGLGNEAEDWSIKDENEKEKDKDQDKRDSDCGSTTSNSLEVQNKTQSSLKKEQDKNENETEMEANSSWDSSPKSFKGEWNLDQSKEKSSSETNKDKNDIEREKDQIDTLWGSSPKSFKGGWNTKEDSKNKDQDKTEKENKMLVNSSWDSSPKSFTAACNTSQDSENNFEDKKRNTNKMSDNTSWGSSPKSFKGGWNLDVTIEKSSNVTNKDKNDFEKEKDQINVLWDSTPKIFKGGWNLNQSKEKSNNVTNKEKIDIETEKDQIGTLWGSSPKSFEGGWNTKEDSKNKDEKKTVEKEKEMKVNSLWDSPPKSFKGGWNSHVSVKKKSKVTKNELKEKNNKKDQTSSTWGLAPKSFQVKWNTNEGSNNNKRGQKEKEIRTGSSWDSSTKFYVGSGIGQPNEVPININTSITNNKQYLSLSKEEIEWYNGTIEEIKWKDRQFTNWADIIPKNIVFTKQLNPKIQKQNSESSSISFISTQEQQRKMILIQSVKKPIHNIQQVYKPHGSDNIESHKKSWDISEKLNDGWGTEEKSNYNSAFSSEQNIKNDSPLTINDQTESETSGKNNLEENLKNQENDKLNNWDNFGDNIDLGVGNEWGDDNGDDGFQNNNIENKSSLNKPWSSKPNNNDKWDMSIGDNKNNSNSEWDMNTYNTKNEINLKGITFTNYPQNKTVDFQTIASQNSDILEDYSIPIQKIENRLVKRKMTNNRYISGVPDEYRRIESEMVKQRQIESRNKNLSRYQNYEGKFQLNLSLYLDTHIKDNDQQNETNLNDSQDKKMNKTYDNTIKDFFKSKKKSQIGNSGVTIFKNSGKIEHSFPKCDENYIQANIDQKNYVNKNNTVPQELKFTFQEIVDTEYESELKNFIVSASEDDLENYELLLQAKKTNHFDSGSDYNPNLEKVESHESVISIQKRNRKKKKKRKQLPISKKQKNKKKKSNKKRKHHFKKLINIYISRELKIISKVIKIPKSSRKKINHAITKKVYKKELMNRIKYPKQKLSKKIEIEISRVIELNIQQKMIKYPKKFYKKYSGKV
ncbi:hypothetical protein M0812_13526 [Anaeramoeba flamelloides]|uniref:Uncharacterized protein n=1 Tax=Anaeramoeba flamelloides TaxID=1746091 RepID=A0AAV7ZME1_9EUKA|nr:hypothetical protein M0812_13526 [Anaeramoeba flamelloides]